MREKPETIEGVEELTLEEPVSRTVLILEKAIETVKSREAQYGAAEGGHHRLAETLLALCGEIQLVNPSDYIRFHLLATIVGKLSRYVFSFEQGGHRDSIHDAGIYCLLLELEDERWFDDHGLED